MTVWIVHQPMSAEEEEGFTKHLSVRLPFDGVPDLTHVSTRGQAKRMMMTLYPNDPPETITTRCDRFWNIVEKVQVEDIIAVPLPLTQRMAIAQAVGKYQYHVGANGEDLHSIPVQFHLNVKAGKFRNYKELFHETAHKIVAIEDAQLRTLIREQLPYRYNRFAKYKWLLIVFFLMSLVHFLQSTITP
jgi:predicted Mrr-cat superfamily restriction endonuclease